MHHNTEQYLPLVQSIARSVVAGLPPSIEIGDLISEGVLALYAALDSFDASRGVPFAAYARLRIRGAMLDSVRADYRHSLRHSELSDNLPAATSDPDRRIAAKQSLRGLNSSQRSVITSRIHGCTKRETGRRLGLSEQWVGTLERQAIGRMRLAMAA